MHGFRGGCFFAHRHRPHPPRAARAGQTHSFGGTYLDLKPGELIRHTDAFDDPHLPGEMQTTISLKKVSVGTELDVVQVGIPEAIEACCLGWQESLELLTRLVEAEIPG